MGVIIPSVKYSKLGSYESQSGDEFEVNESENYYLLYSARISNLDDLQIDIVISGGKGSKAFKVSGSKKENGPWQTLVEAELVDTTGDKAASLLNFTFKVFEGAFIDFDAVTLLKVDLQFWCLFGLFLTLVEQFFDVLRQHWAWLSTRAREITNTACFTYKKPSFII